MAKLEERELLVDESVLRRVASLVNRRTDFLILFQLSDEPRPVGGLAIARILEWPPDIVSESLDNLRVLGLAQRIGQAYKITDPARRAVRELENLLKDAPLPGTLASGAVDVVTLHGGDVDVIGACTNNGTWRSFDSVALTGTATEQGVVGPRRQDSPVAPDAKNVDTAMTADVQAPESQEADAAREYAHL